jgi:hypothetical protein
MDDNCLTSVDLDSPVSMIHVQGAPEDERELVELRRLSRLDPTRRAVHVGDAQYIRIGVDPSDEFVDNLGLGSSGWYP